MRGPANPLTESLKVKQFFSQHGRTPGPGELAAGLRVGTRRPRRSAAGQCRWRSAALQVSCGFYCWSRSCVEVYVTNSSGESAMSGGFEAPRISPGAQPESLTPKHRDDRQVQGQGRQQVPGGERPKMLAQLSASSLGGKGGQS